MDYELAKIVHGKRCSWVYSGQDERCRDTLLHEEIYNIRAKDQIRVVILTEETENRALPMVTAKGNVKGILPAYSCRYFPVFDGPQGETAINRLLHLIRLTGASEAETGRVNSYISYLLCLEELVSGHTPRLDLNVINKYSGISSVESAIHLLVRQRRISEMQKRALLERFSETAPAAPLLENVLSVLNHTFFLQRAGEKRISWLHPGDCICFLVKNDMTQLQKQWLFQLVAWDILDACRLGLQVAVSIIEEKKKYGQEMLSLLEQTAGYARVTYYARDFFVGHSEEWKDEVRGYFDAWIFSAHASMKSCEAVSDSFGTMPIIRNSYSCDRDRRLASNRLIDRILGTNRIDHYMEHVPAWEPKFRKEEIQSMQEGMCLVNYQGEGYWVTL